MHGQRQYEYGARDVAALWIKAEQVLQGIVDEVKKLPIDPVQAAQEPNDLPGIRRVRPDGPRRLWAHIEPAVYREKLAGALLGRIEMKRETL